MAEINMAKINMAKIDIVATDGGTFGAYLSLPETRPAPAIIIIQEIFGVNQVMRDLTNSFAALGYVAICPDLFWRQQPGVDLTDKSQADWDRAFALLQGFDIDLGIADLAATLNTVRAHEACTGAVATIGYCLGGKLAYLMAARGDADCNIGYYGVDLVSFIGEATAIARPLMLHVAEDDAFVPQAAQAKVAAALAPNPNATIHTYPGVDHAFARVGGEHFNQAAADLADQRTRDFLTANLRGTP